MARRGVRKIDTLKHEVSQMEVPIYLNTNNSTFEAEITQDGERFLSSDLNDLKKMINSYLDNRVDLGWQWVIEIEFMDGRRRSEAFGFSMEKYLLSSHRINGSYLKTERMR